eukprot:TRINITY_DN74314_c0_g1_i1.p1 TRINITY_DN74314_c0_g1~~TRINITY_DN74314_c0_g1_i1.p1  ORF type:complete len:602 (+),score=140.82 TRINITY_DN74314_c0_g1_i1:127-1932(+)
MAVAGLAAALLELGIGSQTWLSLTCEELTKQYKRLALEHHPDKVRARGGDHTKATKKFQSIAWAHQLLKSRLQDASRGSAGTPLPRAATASKPAAAPTPAPARAATPPPTGTWQRPTATGQPAQRPGQPTGAGSTAAPASEKQQPRSSAVESRAWTPGPSLAAATVSAASAKPAASKAAATASAAHGSSGAAAAAPRAADGQAARPAPQAGVGKQQTVTPDNRSSVPVTPPSMPKASSGVADAAKAAEEDSEAPTGCCSACGRRALVLNRTRAISLNIAWEEYIAHPEKLQTCMLCRMAQRSVMNEERALASYPKLVGMPGIFARLQQEKKAFTMNKTVHYWVRDLMKATTEPLETPKKKKPQRRTSGSGSASNAVGIFQISKAFFHIASKCDVLTVTLEELRRRVAKHLGLSAKDLEAAKGTIATLVDERRRASHLADSLSVQKGVSGGLDTPEKTSAPSSRGQKRPLEAAATAAPVRFRLQAKVAVSQLGARPGVGFLYRVVGDKRLGIRLGPDVSAKASPAGHLPPGSAFKVSERKVGADGRLYLKLADGSGWTYDRSAKDFSKVVAREVLPSESHTSSRGNISAPPASGRKRQRTHL